MKNYLRTIKKSIKHWYLLTLSGVIFIGVGIAAFFTPQESYQALSVVFSLSFLVSGISESIFAISNRKSLNGWGWSLAGAILSIIMGIYLLANPNLSMVILPFVAAFYLLYKSAYGIAVSLELKDYGIMDWGYLLALSVAGVITSFLFMMHPVFTGFSLVVLTGVTFILVGAFSIYYSLKLRKINKMLKRIPLKIGDKVSRLFKDLKETIKEVHKEQKTTAKA